MSAGRVSSDAGYSGLERTHVSSGSASSSGTDTDIYGYSDAEDFEVHVDI